MIEVATCSDASEWDEVVLSADGHPLQLWGWGEVKAAHGWSVDRVFVIDGKERLGAAQLLIRRLPSTFRALVYIPRGPVVSEESREAMLNALIDYAKRTYQATVLTIEPHWRDIALPSPWRQSDNTILIPHTLILDLTKSVDELLADIPRKRRYDIRWSTDAVHDIHEVTTKEELVKCLALYHETAQRAGFSLHGDQYYIDIFEKLGKHSRLMAVWNEQGDPIAFTWLAVSRLVAFELYGGINKEGQQLRANFALKWRCITQMQDEGVRQYDFNGLLNDGISNFKRNFASHEDYLVGTYDAPLSPLYPLWSKGLPAAKKIVRIIRK